MVTEDAKNLTARSATYLWKELYYYTSWADPDQYNDVLYKTQCNTNYLTTKWVLNLRITYVPNHRTTLHLIWDGLFVD